MIRTISVLCALLCFAGCSEGPKTVGAPATFENVCDKSNDGKRLSLEGYLDFPSSFKSSEPSIMMRLRPAFDSRATVVGVSVQLGSGPNQVELPPKQFTPADIKLHAGDGKLAGFRDKVRVSGTMYLPSSIAQVEFKCGLANTLIDGPK